MPFKTQNMVNVHIVRVNPEILKPMNHHYIYIYIYIYIYMGTIFCIKLVTIKVN